MTGPPGRLAASVDAFDATASRPAGVDLAALVHPLDHDRFLADYWQRRPVHLRGWPDRFADLFDLDDLHDVLMGPRGAGLAIRVSRDRLGDDGGADRHVAIAPDDVVDHLRAGSSICVDAIDRAVPALHELAATLRRELGHVGPASVKCYLSTDAHGFNTHYDAHVVTTLQLEGTKRWLVSPRPAVEFPVHNAFVDSDGVVHHQGRTPSSLRSWERAVEPPRDLHEVHLEPGDVLCLPAGTWHDAKAEGHSLALNVSFEPIDLLDLVAEAARDLLVDRPRWRAGLSGAAVDDDLASVVDDLRAVLATPELRARVRAAATDLGGRDRARAGRAGASSLPATGPTGTAGPADLQCVLGVADLDRAVRWWTDVLGLEVVRSIPEYGWAELAGGVAGVTIGLTEDRAASVAGGAVLDFRVADLEVHRTRLRAVHAAAVEDGTADPGGAGLAVGDVREVHGIGRFLRVTDPDGNVVMFYQADDEGTNG